MDTDASNLRVLHTPELVGGHAGQLAAAERELGLRSRCISLRAHPFGYLCDETLWSGGEVLISRELKRLHLLWRALREFDVLHFNFGAPLLPTRQEGVGRSASLLRRMVRAAYETCYPLFEFKDVALLRKAGKAIFVTYQGDDARQGSFCRSHFPVSPAGEVDPSYYSLEADEKKRRDIGMFDRYADGIYALNPDLLHVLPERARFLPYANVDLRQWQPIPPSRSARPLVVHAPSHRGVKGTRFILDAVSRLRAEGVQFDFVLVEGMTREQARGIYEKSDLVLDQLLVGWYGGLAVESMALGKPVICYIREEDLRFVDSDMKSQLPVIRAEPQTLCETLRTWLTSKRERLGEIGARSRAYVERWHDPVRIAQSLKTDYVAAFKSHVRRSH